MRVVCAYEFLSPSSSRPALNSDLGLACDDHVVGGIPHRTRLPEADIEAERAPCAAPAFLSEVPQVHKQYVLDVPFHFLS
jgi:hypothetical protein